MSGGLAIDDSNIPGLQRTLAVILAEGQPMRYLVDNYAAHSPIRDLLFDLAQGSLGDDGDDGSLSGAERAARSKRSTKLLI